MIKRHVFYGMLLLGTSLWLVPGCGNPSDSRVDYPHTRLTGAVTINGKPLEDGLIMIMPQGSGHGGGVKAQVKEGHYTVDRAPLGKVLVTFNAMKATGHMVSSPSSDEPIPEYVNLIPAAYRGGVGITITENHADQDFQL